jgi:hypothetical protein
MATKIYVTQYHFEIVLEFSSTLPQQLLFVYDICIQEDSLGGGPELAIMNHAIMYRRKRKLASTYLDICGDI